MKKIVASLIVLTLVSACNSSNETEKMTIDKETHRETNNDNHLDVIQLNNGQKWVINEEMKPHILNGATILSNYKANKETDHLMLAEQLKEQNKTLIKSCTMKGAAHDELHKWLHPHIKLIEELKNADNTEDANEIIHQLTSSFDTFNTYFK